MNVDVVMVKNNSDGSGATTSTSSRNKSTLGYCACDYGLVLVQRFLICISVLLGFDPMSSSRVLPKIRILRAMTRIIRNFFYVTKAVRKWLAINYNDGIIPAPPIRVDGGNRSARVVRSTPRDSLVGSGASKMVDGPSGSLKHSPIERRYSEPASGYDFATALKDRHNQSHGVGANGLHHHCRYDCMADNHSSDFLWHSSSLSFRFLLNGLAQSFLGYIEDPDVEVNRKEEEAEGKAGSAQDDGGKRDTHREKNTTDEQQMDKDKEDIVAENIGEPVQNVSAKSQATTTDSSGSAGDVTAENRRRNEMVVESVLENDAQQQLKMNSSDSLPEDQKRMVPPLPVPNFDDTTSPPPSSSTAME